MSVLNRFDRLARYYDLLKRIVFGRTIYDSEVRFLSAIPPGANVLIIGGGSGEMLPYLMKVNPACKVWFVEASAEMLRLAGNRLSGPDRSRVEFVHGTVLTYHPPREQDAVVTTFFLDLFSEEALREVCSRIDQGLRPGGVWLVSDFVRGRTLWQRFLLWSMYRFFSVTAGIDAGRLPQWQQQVRGLGMHEISSQTYYGGFIKSVFYRKEY